MTSPAIGRANGIPVLGFGTYPLTGDEAEACVATALELGYRHIDTAQMYGNEKEVGRAIARSGIPREEFFVVTKVDPSNIDAPRFADSVARSVEALGFVPDLLLIHWPPPDQQVEGPVERLMKAKADGMAHAIGISNFTTAQMRRAQQIAGGKLLCNQVEFHPLLDQSMLLDTAREVGLVLTAYCPLARGKAMQQPIVQQIAQRHGRPASEIVLRWIIQQGVVAIPMTSKRENAASNLNALTFSLSDEEMAAISRLGTRQGRLIEPSWMAGKWD